MEKKNIRKWMKKKIVSHSMKHPIEISFAETHLFSLFINQQQIHSCIQLTFQLQLQPLQYINWNMQKEFLTTFKRISQRERFYSSMSYEQYYEIFGPSSPLFKPLEDPVGQIPLLQLQTPFSPSSSQLNDDLNILGGGKMDTILEIEGSQNFSQNLLRSPRSDFLMSNTKSRLTMMDGDEIQAPKRVRIRMRSQSDSSEYLIFNFLQRANQKGRKKVKLD